MTCGGRLAEVLVDRQEPTQALLRIFLLSSGKDGLLPGVPGLLPTAGRTGMDMPSSPSPGLGKSPADEKKVSFLAVL